MNTQNPHSQGSQSLFQSGRDNAHSLDDVRLIRQREQQRRVRLFLCFGLPLCILIVIGIVVFLWPRLRPPKRQAPISNPENTAKPGEPEALGKPDAALRLELITPDIKSVSPTRLELIRDAVYTKPSEVFLVISIDETLELPVLKLNGNNEFDVDFDNDVVKRMDLMEMDDTTFKRAIAQAYDSLYGPSMNPLMVLTKTEYAASQITRPHEEEEEEFTPEEIERLEEEMKKQRLSPDSLLLPGLELDPS